MDRVVVIGLDAEWRPTKKQPEDYQVILPPFLVENHSLTPVAVIQLSTQSHVFVIPILQYEQVKLIKLQSVSLRAAWCQNPIIINLMIITFFNSFSIWCCEFIFLLDMFVL